MAKITVCIDCSDMDSAIQFYTKALGCELINEGEEYSELVSDGLTIYLGKNAAGTNPLMSGEAVRSYERHWTPVHLDFIVTNIEECIPLIEQYGGVKEGDKNGEWGSIAFCADPFGNGFCVMQYSS